MADNVLLPATGSGTAAVTQATDDVAGIQYPKVKLVDGTADSTAVIPGSTANGLLTDVSRVQKVGTAVDANNSTTVPLAQGATFTGTATDCLGYSSVSVVLASDKYHSVLAVFSPDGTNWDYADALTAQSAGAASAAETSVRARYMRMVVTQGDTGADTYLRVQTLLHTHPSSVVARANSGPDVPLTVAVSNAVSVQPSDFDGDPLSGHAMPVGGSDGTTTRMLKTDAAGELQVDVLTSPGLTDTQLRATPVPVSGTVTATGPLTDTQLRAAAVPISAATLPLPTGAATSAKQDTGNTSLASIDGKDFATQATLALIKAKTDNLDVALSTKATETTLGTRLSESDYDTKTGSLTEAAPASDTASSGLNGRLQRIAQRITSLIALIPASLGQKAMTASLAVTVASDQSAVPISGTVTANAGTGPFPVSDNAGSLTVDAPVGTPVFSRLSDGAAALIGQKAMTASLPVVIASDQSAVPISGTVTATGPLTDTQLRASAVPVSGPLTDAQLRASAVPVSAATLPLPTGAATETTQLLQATEVSLAKLPQAQGVSSLTLSGPMMQAVVSDSPPSTYLDNYLQPLSLTTSGRLRVSSEPSTARVDFWGDPFEQELMEPAFYGGSSLSFYP